MPTDRGPTEFVRQVAGRTVAQLRKAAEPMTARAIASRGGSESAVTVRKAIEWLRSIGAPIETASRGGGPVEDRGYVLRDRGWSDLSLLSRGELVLEVERVRGLAVAEFSDEQLVAELESRGYRQVPRDLTDWLEAATASDLVAELERKGYAVRVERELACPSVRDLAPGRGLEGVACAG